MNIYKLLKYSLCIVLSVFVIILSGCKEKETENLPSFSSSLQDKFQINTEKMPDIVFMKKTVYNQSNSDHTEYQLTFFDKNGRYYVSDDISVGSLSPEKIVEEFEAGNLMNKVRLTGKSCDKEALDENFSSMCSIYSEESCSIVYADEIPAVESDSVLWYGFCYDINDNIRYILMHDCYSGMEFYSNNDIINDVYEWFNKALKS